jgi:hypothetical protein
MNYICVPIAYILKGVICFEDGCLLGIQQCSLVDITDITPDDGGSKLL